jgi:N-methylhydantoinase A
LADLSRQGFGPHEIHLSEFVDLRYRGQAYELRLPLSADRLLVPSALAEAVECFHATHEERFGFAHPDTAVEIVNLGVTGVALLPRPTTHVEMSSAASWEHARVGTRPVYFPKLRRLTECGVYRRDAAPVGVPLSGPAVIEQYDATTPVDPGWIATRTPPGYLMIVREQ